LSEYSWQQYGTPARHTTSGDSWLMSGFKISCMVAVV
jgi:hypothetical protein